MRTITFAKRCAKEILRDPINLGFGLGFPIILLFLMSAIQSKIPVSLFEIESLTPGICVFGLSFMTMFSATLVAKDRESALLQRLYTTPLGGRDFILGYLIPMIPIALGQIIVCHITAFMLGLKPDVYVILAIFAMLPIAIFNITLGLMLGSLLSVKQVGGICGALLTNLTAYLSGAWVDLRIIGGWFEKIASALPFFHAVEIGKAVIGGNISCATSHLPVVLIYALICSVGSVICFLRQMKKC